MRILIYLAIITISSMIISCFTKNLLNNDNLLVGSWGTENVELVNNNSIQMSDELKELAIEESKKTKYIFNENNTGILKTSTGESNFLWVIKDEGKILSVIGNKKYNAKVVEGKIIESEIEGDPEELIMQILELRENKMVLVQQTPASDIKIYLIKD